MRNNTLSILGGLVILFLGGAQSPASAQSPAPRPPQVPEAATGAIGGKHPKLSSELTELARLNRVRGLAAAQAFAVGRDISLINATARVVIQTRPEHVSAVKNRVEALGGTFEMSASDLVLARVPVSALETLALADEVTVVRRPEAPTLFQTTSQGLKVIGAIPWHQAGRKGAGVKVAILDVGFQGYQSLMGSELPNIPATHIMSFSGDITGSGEKHGTGVAEIVYDVAPEADLYLVNASNEVELDNAVQWLIDQRVNVINASWGYPCSGPLDGTGRTNTLVKRAADAGILWVNASGNFAQRHWSATFNDTNSDGWHNFSATEDGDRVFMNSGDKVQACAVWDDWTTKDQDYDLYVWDSSGSIIASSTDDQSGPSTHDPKESLSFTANAAGYYYIGIKKYRTTRNSTLHLYVYPPGAECAIEAVAGTTSKSNGALADLREFRDQMLRSSDFGKALIKSYYRYSPEVVRILLLHPQLALEAAALVNASRPAVSSVVGIRGGDVSGSNFVISEEFVASVDRFLDQLVALAAPALRGDLRAFRAKLALSGAAGQTADQYWEWLLSQAPLVSGVPMGIYPDPGYMRYTTAATSLVPPADSPHALAVGATNWATDVLEDFSSQGPTSDGRLKPDISAPDGVCTVTYGNCAADGFLGTSAAAPHVTGAAALVRQVYPAASLAEVRNFLNERAVDLPPAGPDNGSGAGRLALGPSGTGAPTVTDPVNQAVTAGANATFTVAASGTPTPTLQWQVSTNAGATWTNLTNTSPYSGVTSATFTISAAPSSFNGRQFRCVATNSAGAATSAAATLTVTTQNPTVSAINPTSGATAGGTAVTITGTNFVAGVTVTIGGTAATVASVTATTITATTPAHAAGAANVVVRNPDGQTGTLTGGFTFSDTPPVETPPDRGDPGEDSGPWPNPAGRAVVITHGWNDDGGGWVKEMAKKVCGKLGGGQVFYDPGTDNVTKVCQTKDWDVWIQDWTSKANTGLLYPMGAFANAAAVGETLASHLKGKNYSHIHFIAHSAGANLIDSATNSLKENRPSLEIHETFLDAYNPFSNPTRYGKQADWTDNYVDTRDVANLSAGLLGFDGTRLFLDNGYNIDVTTTSADDPCQALIDVSSWSPMTPVWGCRHNRPYRFYGVSIDPSFVGHAASAAADPIPINGTGTMGYPLSVEKDQSLSNLRTSYPNGGTCMMNGGVCSPVYLPRTFLNFHWGEVGETVVDAVVGTVDFVAGVGATVYNSLKLGLNWLLPGSGTAVRTASSSTPTESPSWIAVHVTTTQPVNTMRFNWRFAAAGEGFLRVFVDDVLVREIDQRHVSLASVTTEEIYIGGGTGTLAPGVHRIAFRLDGFGTSASGVELTGVELGLTAAVNAGLFYTLTPCRVLDTRNPAGLLGAPPLQPGATRTFDLSASTCGIPTDAVAISANLTVTNVGAPGELVVFPSDVLRPNTSALSFRAGRTRANNAIVSFSKSSTTFSIFNNSAATVDFILDVNGFFR